MCFPTPMFYATCVNNNLNKWGSVNSLDPLVTIYHVVVSVISSGISQKRQHPQRRMNLHQSASSSITPLSIQSAGKIGHLLSGSRENRIY